MPLDPQSIAADAYLFGPIENKQRRIIGLGLILHAELPVPVDELIRQIFGEPTMSAPGVRLWRLIRSISYVDDE